MRSTDPEDYQSVPRPVAVMAKSFAPGASVPPHAHRRDQFLYAVEGVTRVTTTDSAWILPPDRALYLPAGTRHAVVMKGRVEMRTLYIRQGVASRLPSQCTAMEVSALLRSLILALLEEPVLYEEGGRGGLLAQLILDEVARTPPLAMGLPMPRDARLLRLCERLMAAPGATATLDDLSQTAGASARTLSRLFQRETGLTFTGWRQRLRFANAMEALVRGEPVGLVARDNGYASASAFTAAFRKALGVTPASLASGKGGEA